LDCSCR